MLKHLQDAYFAHPFGLLLGFILAGLFVCLLIILMVMPRKPAKKKAAKDTKVALKLGRTKAPQQALVAKATEVPSRLPHAGEKNMLDDMGLEAYEQQPPKVRAKVVLKMVTPSATNKPTPPLRATTFQPKKAGGGDTSSGGGGGG